VAILIIDMDGKTPTEQMLQRKTRRNKTMLASTMNVIDRAAVALMLVLAASPLLTVLAGHAIL
jgi:hypothetical protein